MNHAFTNLLSESKNPRTSSPRGERSVDRPTFAFEFQDDWTFGRTASPALALAPDFSRVSFEADFVAIAKQANRPLSPFETDFIWVALAAYLADRFAPRHPFGLNGVSCWRRHITVSVPVSESAHWNEVRECLVHALEFLTEDDWSFEFRGDRARFNAETQEHFRQFSRKAAAWTALFSGGLDSLAGALQYFSESPGAGLLVSGQTNNRIAVGQREQVCVLRELFPQRVEHVGVEYVVPDKNGITAFESSQRTRAFIHIALGAVASLINGGSTLYLFENGVGALNLSCDSAQIGSQCSRGTHPVFLRRMAALVAACFGRPFTIKNPFLGATKAQMLPHSSDTRVESLLQRSFSCERFPNYPHKAPQCGRCASCLVRRMSLHAAGHQDEGTAYTFDIFAPERSQGLRAKELLAQSKLAVQADNLHRQLESDDPWLALTSTWPELLRAEWELKQPNFDRLVITLLRRHVSEWQTFAIATGRRQLKAVA